MERSKLYIEDKSLKNPSASNTTKASNCRKELERKNNRGGQPKTSRSKFKGFPSLIEGRFVEIVDLYLLFQSPKKYARII
jgi:hypothetical protein